MNNIDNNCQVLPKTVQKLIIEYIVLYLFDSISFPFHYISSLALVNRFWFKIISTTITHNNKNEALPGVSKKTLLSHYENPFCIVKGPSVLVLSGRLTFDFLTTVGLNDSSMVSSPTTATATETKTTDEEMSINERLRAIYLSTIRKIYITGQVLLNEHHKEVLRILDAKSSRSPHDLSIYIQYPRPFSKIIEFTSQLKSKCYLVRPNDSDLDQLLDDSTMSISANTPNNTYTSISTNRLTKVTNNNILQLSLIQLSIENIDRLLNILPLQMVHTLYINDYFHIDYSILYDMVELKSIKIICYEMDSEIHDSLRKFLKSKDSLNSLYLHLVFFNNQWLDLVENVKVVRLSIATLNVESNDSTTMFNGKQPLKTFANNNSNLRNLKLSVASNISLHSLCTFFFKQPPILTRTMTLNTKLTLSQMKIPENISQLYIVHLELEQTTYTINMLNSLLYNRHLRFISIINLDDLELFLDFIECLDETYSSNQHSIKYIAIEGFINASNLLLNQNMKIDYLTHFFTTIKNYNMKYIESKRTYEIILQ